MLLKNVHLAQKAPLIIWTVTMVLMATFAEAKSLSSSTLEVGTYSLISGEPELCGKTVEISKNDLTEKTLFIGSRYSYELKNSQYQIESDIDPTCEFKEINAREDVGLHRTIFTRINKELCRGTLRSITTSTATLTSGEIEIRHEIDTAEPYTCQWRKKN